jgi:exosortase A-associated hydrolase 1
MTRTTESAFTFACPSENQGSPDELIGIAHLPAKQTVKYGLLILVGGPQYRVGPHRQYVHLARHLSEKGIPAMRFDFRGVGDSEGYYPGFQGLGPDLAAAMTAFEAQAPGLDGIVLWGLCEGASSILLAGVQDARVKAAVLLNPWVRSEATLARTHLKHYYLKRFLSADLWRRILGGKANPKVMATSFIATLRGAFKSTPETAPQAERPFQKRMAEGLQNFKGQVLLIQSGNDLVAREFDDLTKSDPDWQCLGLPNVERFDLPESDHSFSTEVWRQAVAEKIEQWMKEL